MAEIQVERNTETEREDATIGEIIFWIIGILMIPLVPIAMVMLLTPYSGM